MNAWRVFGKQHFPRLTLKDRVILTPRRPFQENKDWDDRSQQWQKDRVALATTNTCIRGAMMPLFVKNINITSSDDTKEIVKRKCNLGRFYTLFVRIYPDILDVLTGLSDECCRELRCLRITINRPLKKKRRYWDKYVEEIVIYLVSRCSRLVEFHMEDLNGVTDRMISILSTNCRGLTSINLRRTNITDSNVTTLAKNCRSLEIVGLSSCGDITDVGFQALSRYCSSLTSLDLEATSITRDGISTLAANCHNLVAINLNMCNFLFDDAMVRLVSNCKNLICIDLGRFDGFQSYFVDDTLSAMGQHCTDLVHISINEMDVKDEGIVALTQGCSELTSIDVNGTQITDEGIVTLTQCCGKLTSIDANCTRITDVAMVALSTCVNLHYLILYGTDITDEGIIALTTGCHGLFKIDLRYCENLTDRSIVELAAVSHNLSHIDLTDCANLTDLSIFALAANCPLIGIDLSGCCRVTDEGIIRLASKCGDLREINLSSGGDYGPNITDMSIVTLLAGCPKLHRVLIDIEDPPRFSKDIISKIKTMNHGIKVHLYNLISL